VPPPSASPAERPGSRAGAAATRERLLEAGRAAFSARGHDATNLREHIRAPAHVSVGSFHHHYRDKTELLLDILGEHAHAFRDRLSDAHRPEPGRTLDEIAYRSYSVMFDIAQESESVLRIWMHERQSSNPRLRQFLADDRQQWVDALSADYQRVGEVLSHDVSSTLLAQLIHSLAIETAFRWLEFPTSERPEERERLLDGLARFTLGGIAALSGPGALPAPQKTTNEG